jgi:ammonium transporter Rh
VLAIGLVAGAMGTCGYVKLSPKLESCIGLRDTCGVHNLHGMPGILGGLAAALASVLAAAGNASVLSEHGSR